MKSFGPFILVERLARGGMGDVWLAEPRGLAAGDARCIVKTIRATLSGDEEAITRFLDETAVGLLLDHPNICRMIDAGHVQGARYIALEIIEGVDAKTLSSRAGNAAVRLPVEVALHVGVGLCAGLHAAHVAVHPLTGEALGVVHRDVSPQNVMVDADGAVKVIDFGLSLSSMKRAQTAADIVLGKPAYMSPEQARGQPVDASTDQFSAAVVLYELLTGERFYGDLTSDDVWRAAGTGGWVPPRFDLVDTDLRPVLARALQSSPERRFPSCAGFGQALTERLAARGDLDAARQSAADLVTALAAPELARLRVAPSVTSEEAPAPATVSLAVREAVAIAALAEARRRISARGPPTMRVIDAPTVRIDAPTLMRIDPPTLMLTEQVQRSPAPQPAAPRRRRTAVVVVAASLALLALVGGAGAAFFLGAPLPTTTPIVGAVPVAAPPVDVVTPPVDVASPVVVAPPVDVSPPVDAQPVDVPPPVDVVPPVDVAPPVKRPTRADAVRAIDRCALPCAGVLRDGLAVALPQDAEERAAVDAALFRCAAACRRSGAK